MNAKRLLALLVVICMMGTCLVGVADTGSSETIRSIESKEAVVIDVEADFESNANQLKKLGITNEKDWEYDVKERCYVLTLDGVEFVTTANVALAFVSESTVKNPKVIVKLEGDNRFVSGSRDVTGGIMEGCTTSILGVHYTDAENPYEDMTVEFTGEGKIIAENDITSDDTIYVCGIRVYGTLMVTGGAYVNAVADAIENTITKPTYHIYTIGIYVNKLVTNSIDKMSRIDSRGGDIKTIVDVNLEFIMIASTGIMGLDYECKDSIIYGTGGNISCVNKYIEENEVIVKSLGISETSNVFLTESSETTLLDGCKVVGISGTVDGICQSTESTGMGLSNGSGWTKVIDSIVIGRSDDTVSEGVDNNLSSGLVLYGEVNIEKSYVQGVSGVSDSPVLSSTYGVSLELGNTIKQSIIHAYAKQSIYSFGIHSTDEISIYDSEIYSAGDISVNGEKMIKAHGDCYCYCFNQGKRIDPDNMSCIDGSVKSAELLFKRDIVFTSEEYGIIGFERTSDDSFVIGDYTGYVPEGKRFSHFEYDGKVLHEGDEIPIDDYILVEVVFADSSGSDFPVGWVAAIVTAVAGLAALFLLIFYARRRRDEY